MTVIIQTAVWVTYDFLTMSQKKLHIHNVENLEQFSNLYFHNRTPAIYRIFYLILVSLSLVGEDLQDCFKCSCNDGYNYIFFNSLAKSIYLFSVTLWNSDIHCLANLFLFRTIRTVLARIWFLFSVRDFFYSLKQHLLCSYKTDLHH